MIGRKTALAFANVAVGALLGLAALKVAALWFGIDVYGQVNYAMGLLGIVALLVDLNIADAHVKRVSEGWDADDCFVTFATFKLVSTGVFLAIAGGILYAYTGALGKPLVSTTAPVLFAVMGYYVAKNAMVTAQSTFEAKRETARFQMGNLVETAVRVLLTFVGAAILAAVLLGVGPLGGRLSLDSPAAAFARENPGAMLALTFTGGALMGAVFSVGLMIRTMKGRGRFRWEILRSYVSFAIPLFLVSAVAALSVYVDRTALGFFGAPSDAADLGAPRQIVGVLEGLSAGASGLLFPTLSGLVAQGNHQAATEAVRRSVRYLSLVILPLVAFLVAFPERVILLVLSDQWQGTGLVLILLAISVFVTILTRPLLNLVMGLNQTRVAARIGIVGASLNIVLVILLVPDDIRSLGIRLAGLKAVGAALALLASALAMYGMLRWHAWRTTGYRQGAHVWKHVAAALVMVGALRVADAWGPVPVAHWWSFPLYGLVGTLVYGAVLVAMREITAEDFAYARETLHPGEMIRYLRTELFDREG